MSRSRYSLIILRKTITAKTTLYRNRQNESMLIWRLSCWRKSLARYSAIFLQNNRLKTAYRRAISVSARANAPSLWISPWPPLSLPSFLSSIRTLSYLVYVYPSHSRHPLLIRPPWSLKLRTRPFERTFFLVGVTRGAKLIDRTKNTILQCFVPFQTPNSVAEKRRDLNPKYFLFF